MWNIKERERDGRKAHTLSPLSYDATRKSFVFILPLLSLLFILTAHTACLGEAKYKQVEADFLGTEYLDTHTYIQESAFYLFLAI